MDVRTVAVILAITSVPAAALADPVAGSFYARCVKDNAYQMEPAQLTDACACMAPVLASFLTPEARAQIEDAIRHNRSVSLTGNPYQGSPGDIARAAVKQCPGVGAAMYQRKCTGAQAQAPECQEMEAMLGQ